MSCLCRKDARKDQRLQIGYSMEYKKSEKYCFEKFRALSFSSIYLLDYEEKCNFSLIHSGSLKYLKANLKKSCSTVSR